MHLLAYLYLVSFLVTVFCLQWWQHTNYPLWLWGSMGVLMSIGVVYRITIGKYLCAATCGLFCAFLTVVIHTHISSANTIDGYALGQTVELQGEIDDEPDKRPMQTKYTIAVDSLTDGSGTLIRGITGKVLVTDNRQWPEYAYGDSVTVRGKLEKPEPIETFAYNNYLSRYDIYSVMYRASLTKNIDTPRKEFLMGYKNLYALKNRFESQINMLYPEPHASFMAGLLTGSRKGIPEIILEEFNQTGLTHIIAISGYNITIVIAIISSMLFWLPLQWRFVPATVAIIIFTVFVGASAAVVRAAIMGILGLLALQSGRTSTIRLSILWTAWIMIVYNPKILWYDAGFQLSFLAVIGLTEIGTLLEKPFAWLPNTFAIRESLQMTIAAQIFAVPLIVMLFGRFSLIAPIANMLVAPVLPLAMLFGAVGTLLSFFVFPLGQLVAYLGFGCLQWILFITHVCSSIPFASIDLHIPLWMLGIYYVVVMMVTIRCKAISNLAI